MARKDTDNLLKFLTQSLTLNGGNIVSEEVDLELPRGFVAKIRKMIFKAHSIQEDLEGIVTRETMEIQMALVRDPDDAVTTTMPDGQIQHDVIGQHNVDIIAGFIVADMTTMYTSETLKMLDFTELEDVITARNMRFNCIGLGADAADLTESHATVEIHYTLEKVTNMEILDLLDIL